jgi:hypothetical protein
MARGVPSYQFSVIRYQLLEVGEDFLFFDGAVDVSQVIAKRVTGVGCSLLQVTGEVQLCAQRASSLDRFRLLPLPLPNGPGGCK